MNRESFPAGSQGDSAGRIVEILLRDHLESDKLAPICDRMRFGARIEFKEFLEAAMERNSHRDVQGLACLALAQLLNNHLRMIDLAEDRPELVSRYDHIFGAGYLEGIGASGRSSLVERVEALFERATDFDEVINQPFQETIAEKAKLELYELRHLSPGKIAPDIEGRDEDGQLFQLSEYRGKVVLLYFWMEY